GYLSSPRESCKRLKLGVRLKIPRKGYRVSIVGPTHAGRARRRTSCPAPARRHTPRAGSRCRTYLVIAVEPTDGGVQEDTERPRIPREVVFAEQRFRAELNLEAEAGTHLVATSIVLACRGDDVAVDLAHGAVAAKHPDPERVVYGVLLDRPHRHLGHGDSRLGRSLDVVVHQHRHRAVGDDPDHPAANVAIFDDASALNHVIRDVDALPERSPAHVDVAVLNGDRGVAHVDAVELGTRDRHVVEHDAFHPGDADAVLSTDHTHVADLHVGV